MIDTAEKRFSMLNFGDGAHLHVMFEPDGAVDLDDRQHLLDLYAGIALGGAVTPSLQRTSYVAFENRTSNVAVESRTSYVAVDNRTSFVPRDKRDSNA